MISAPPAPPADFRPKVTVYTPSRNYGRFLGKALSSIFAQTMPDWEVLVFLEGSEDESEQVATQYAMASPERVRIFRHEEPKGLQHCANTAIQEARGDFIVRLDADDFLDENALLVLSNYLERNPETALVYPNYFYVDEGGEIIDVDIRKKVGTEARVLDLPAHGACTMFRKRVLKTIGGYDEAINAQDGYDIWLSIVGRFPVANVSTPLFFYRQHGASLTRDESRILNAQSEIRAAHVQRGGRGDGKVRLKIAAVVGAKLDYPGMPGMALQEIGGRPLLNYTVDAAQQSGLFDEIIVTTDAEQVVDHCKATWPEIRAYVRPDGLSETSTKLEAVISEAVMRLEKSFTYFPDIVVFLNSNAPLRRGDHIRNAVNTLLLHNTDSVFSVYEDFDLHYLHGGNGLVPLSRERHMQLRIEREALYVDNRAVQAAWREVITETDFKGSRVGHFIMPMMNSFHIRSKDEFELVSRLIEHPLSS